MLGVVSQPISIHYRAPDSGSMDACLAPALCVKPEARSFAAYSLKAAASKAAAAAAAAASGSSPAKAVAWKTTAWEVVFR